MEPISLTKPVIAVSGSVNSKANKSDKKKAYRIGREIAKNGGILLTGACPGLPLEAARGAKEKEGLVIGVSAASDRKQHTKVYKYPVKPFDMIVYTGFGFKGKNVIMVRTADAVIIAGGGMGTLNEFTIAFDEAKTIGILLQTKGVAREAKGLITKLKSRQKGKIFYSKKPEELVRKVLRGIKKEAIKKLGK